MTKYNVIYNTIYQIINLLIPIITAPYLARVIGAEGVGLNAYTKAIASYFILFAMQGLNNYGNRSIALAKTSKEKLSRTFLEIYTLQFLSSSITCIVYIVYLSIYSNESYKLALFINAIYVLSSCFDINWFYWGIGEFKFTTIRNIFIKSLTTICVFLFVKKREDIYIYILIISIGFLSSNLVLWFKLKKYISFVGISFKEIIKHVKPNFILFIPVLAVSIYKLMDKVMLGYLVGVIPSAYYENASSIVTIPLSVITAMGTVMLPRISDLINLGQIERVKNYNRDSIQLMLGLSLPFSMGIIITANEFVPWFFGVDFRKTVEVLQLLAITCPFIAIANVVRTQCIIPQNKDYIYVKSTVIGAIINFIINLLLIPSLEAIGAAIGTIIAEVFVSLYQLQKVKKDLDGIPILKDNFIFLFASIIMAVLIGLVGSPTKNIIILLLIKISGGMLVYCFIVVLYFMYFRKERLEYWLKIIMKK